MCRTNRKTGGLMDLVAYLVMDMLFVAMHYRM